MKKVLLKNLWLLACGLVLGLAANAATYTSVQSGNWNDAATWGGTAAANGNGNIYIIDAGHTVTMNTNNNQYKEIEIRGTLKFGQAVNTGNNNGSASNTVYGNLLTSYNVRLTRDGATLDCNSYNIQLYNITIDTQNADDVVFIKGTSSGTPFTFGNNANIDGTLTFAKGLLNVNGQYLKTGKKFYVHANTGSGFASSIDGSCEHADADAGTFTYEGDSGEQIYITGNVVFYNFISTKTNWQLNGGNYVTIMGEFKRNGTGNNNQKINGGYFTWGPNSNRSGNYAPNGEYNASDLANAAANINGGANSAYALPTSIELAQDACASCTAVNQTLTVSAENATICTGTSTNIQVQNSEVDVLYALFAGSTQVGADVTGDGGTINLPTGNLTATTAFTVKTSENNAVACPNKKIGENVTVTVNAASVAGTAAATTATIGDGSTAEIKLTDNTGTIQWQQSEDGVTNWQNLTGKTAATLTTEVLSEIKDYFFRTVVTSGVCDADTSGIVTISVIDHTTVDEDANAPVCEPQSCSQANKIQKVGTAPAIDGVKESLWNNSYEYSISKRVVGADQTGFSGKWYALYDATNIYLFVEVVKPTAYPTLTASQWSGDGIELGFVVNNAVKQYGILYNKTIAAGTGAPGTTISIENSTGTGTYELEISVPWTEIGYSAAPADMTDFKMEVAVDINNGGGRAAQYTTFATNSNWYNTAGSYPVNILACVGYADLEILDVTPDNDNILLGDDVTGNISVINNGNVDASNVKFKLEYNGQYFYTTYSVAAGANENVAFSFKPSSVSGGAKSLIVTANSNNAIKESDCGNNIATAEITVNDVSTNIGSSQIAANIIGYYDILGKKLSKAPENGVYIIKYDNGKAEKVVK
ncbi:hypothetical protein FACS189434_08710 [Bacteroidia bacterium]|nr:hypothetical protein FACS189434_08710 [Bacteroidia bacterium]